MEAGVKEVTLLGQNVNSYMDKSEESLSIFGSELVENQPSNLAKGFKTIYKPKLGGLRYVHNFREINSLVTSSVKTLLSRNFRQTCAGENFCKFQYAVWTL